MKNLTFVFACLISVSVFGQTEYTSEDVYHVGDSIALLVLNNQPVNGIVTKYWDNGKLMSEKSYEEGLRVGEFKDYYENGELEHNIIFEKGVYISCVGYYKNGAVEHEKDTDRNVFYYKNGKLLGEGNKNKNDELEGLFKEYYKNGKLKRESNYKNGEEDGVFKQYHKNGRLAIQGEYLGGVKVDNWSYYDKRGNIMESLDFYLSQDSEETEYVIPYHPNLKIFGHYNWWINDHMIDNLKDIFMLSDSLPCQEFYRKVFDNQKNDYYDRFDLLYGELQEGQDLSLIKEYHPNGNLKEVSIIGNYFGYYSADYDENGNLIYFYDDTGNILPSYMQEKQYDQQGQLINEKYGQTESLKETRNGVKVFPAEPEWEKSYIYYDNGFLKSMIKNSLISGAGKQLFYYENGQLHLEKDYSLDGELISSQCYDESGNEIPCE